MLTQPELGHRLRALRLADGRSIEKLAHAAGLSYTTLQSIETGQSVPDLMSVLSLVDALGCSLDAVLRERVHLSRTRARRRGERTVLGEGR